MCKYSILFTKLLGKGLPAVVVRTINMVYEKQCAWVRWGKARSKVFQIVNGTRHGSVLSPALFSIYIDEILVNIRNLGVGCYVGELFMGAMGYAYDLLLPAPSRTAMQMMFQACEEFGNRNNLLFSTDPGQLKSNQVFGKKKLDNPVPLCLNGRELLWLSTATHLYVEVSEYGAMDTVINYKNAVFITRSLEVRE